jgi:hypothetical protein
LSSSGPDGLEARIICKFNPNAARFAHNEMDLGALSGDLRRELRNYTRPLRDTLIQPIQPGSVSDREGEVVQSDIGTPIERGSTLRRFDLPKCHYDVIVRDENRGILRPLTHHPPPEAIAEKSACPIKVANAEADMVDATRGWEELLCHRCLSLRWIGCAHIMITAPASRVA